MFMTTIGQRFNYLIFNVLKKEISIFLIQISRQMQRCLVVETHRNFDLLNLSCCAPDGFI